MTRREIGLAAVVMSLTLPCSCGGNSGGPTKPSNLDQTAASPPAAPPALPVVFVGAGDIAGCPDHRGADATARLLDTIDGLVFTAGDNAYERGTAWEFANCYEPSWGRHKNRTRPSPGNHDYYTTGAVPYYEYFGDRAGPAGRGYYSYDYGDWKIFSLNSNVPAGPGSAQAVWLEQELLENTAKCTLAYWHHPVFSSGFEGDYPVMHYVWDLLYAYQTEIVIAGHSHDYERMSPQDNRGRLDDRHGIREFVVGTGGNGFTAMGPISPNSQIVNASVLGVLKLTLAAGNYTWEFVPVAGGSFHDSGTGTCF